MSTVAHQVGAERFNLFTGCPKARTATMVLRGGSEQFIDEAERSLHDAIMIVRRALKNAAVVGGGGAIDMEVSRCGWPHAHMLLTAKQAFTAWPPRKAKSFCHSPEPISSWLHRQLRDHARAIPGKAQLFINAFAKALEVIPRQLCDNSGFDATDVLNKLRQKHALKDGSGRNFGVDVNNGASRSNPGKA